ncbi:hypothetical protein DCAR_0729945 [Daucus carota subsp. sativus]|uniref:Uncharacterized protein n=1 Tax=Daucus carota subsp. sativus TaxID=79200 RepID=A0AAF1BBT3_DAUCS|nr:PREDICTED: uncharacterized protein LOC108192624 [Daucus carota subsp. sativus]XP_017228277.1 PREDICTED: uncharacterized protein LOC108192624 [Daucus carota subsp. sativus]XP_017228279.1 PREDICTED: uncharacterized protein LOC108192624 [Daucus carota subsp. sativus]WOH10476.1 hypothetical protein DCAR_0729945 [Daucus carota subsp. sativus]
MAQLYLSEPSWDHIEDDASVKQRISLLTKLETIILSLLSYGGRSEARLWLCNTLSGMSLINPRNQQEVFVKLLRSKPRKLVLASQLLQMIFEKRPERVGAILAKNCHMLEIFFRGHPDRIIQWFSSFSGSGDLQHRKGAKALSQFAFVNRDLCWEELEWKGKHGQSPAVVATKPHYFLDIDIQQTVNNFLEYVPEFWSSREFAESLEGGEILFMDVKFFVQLFLDFMYKDDLKEMWEVVDEFLMDESFSSLCQHLLIVLEERDLLLFLKLSRKVLKLKREHIETGSSFYWFEMILSKFSISDSMDELLLLNAVMNKGRQLLRLICEEEAHEEKMQIQDIVRQVCESSCHHSSLVPLMLECIKTKSLNPIKWLGLQSFALHYRLSEESQTRDTWEIIFRSNGIFFRNSENYPLLDPSGFSEDTASDSDKRNLIGVKRRKKEKHGKKRRKHRDHDKSNNALFDLDFSNNSPSLLSLSSGWLLSTDGYSTVWNTVDLPEHLSRHCFSTWLKWIFTKWDNSE